MTRQGRETVFKKAFDESIKRTTQPDWIRAKRKEAFDLFTSIGFPTTKDEEWKYTAIDGDFLIGPDLTHTKTKLKGIDLKIESSNRIVFIDGIVDEEYTRLADVPEGVKIKSFTDAFDETEFQANLGTIVDTKANGFTALNFAFIEEGLFIYVPKNCKISSPIHVEFVSTKEVATFPRILFVGQEGSEAELIERFTRVSETRNFTNAVTEIVLADNARLKHIRVQRESHKALHIGISQASLNRSSVFDSTNINLGGKTARHEANVRFNAEGGEAWIDGLYLVEEGQHTDTHSHIHHDVKHCVSHQSYKGILDGRSRAVFNGVVFVERDASGTNAEQSNKNLLLSNEARVDTKPQLEIFNDDVKCAHGATVGQLEEEELFYLSSRGLNEELARNLLTYGFAEEIINKIEIKTIKRELDEAVLNRLHARLEA